MHIAVGGLLVGAAVGRGASMAVRAGIKCVVGLRGRWTLIQSMGISLCNKLLLGLGSKDHKNMSFCRMSGAGHGCGICRWFWETLSPDAFSQVTQKNEDELSVTRIYSLTSSPPCLRRLLILARQGRAWDKPV